MRIQALNTILEEIQQKRQILALCLTKNVLILISNNIKDNIKTSIDFIENTIKNYLTILRYYANQFYILY